MIVTDERVPRFVSKRLGVALCPPFTAMGIERDGQVIAGAVFNQFEGPNVHVSIAGWGWTRAFIDAVGAYVFDQLGCLRMTVTTEHKAVADYALRLGGQVEGRMTDYFGEGRDGLLIGILKRNWLSGRFAPLRG